MFRVLVRLITLKFFLHIAFLAFLIQSVTPLFRVCTAEQISSVLADDACDAEGENEPEPQEHLGKEQLFHYHPIVIELSVKPCRQRSAKVEAEQSHYRSSLHAGLPDLPPEPFV